MLTTISWTDYIKIIALLLFIYYLVIGIKFYAIELRQLFQSKSKLSTPLVAPTKAIPQNEVPADAVQEIQHELFPSLLKTEPQQKDNEDNYQQAQELTASLKETIAQAASQNYIKDEFIFSLQQLLKQYSFLKASPFLGPINNLIASECEKYGYLQLSAEERVQLWNE